MEKIEYKFSKSFLKDLKRLKKSPEYKKLVDLCIHQIPAYTDINDIPALKKMKGYATYYRIRCGDHRIGVKITEGTVTFLRLLHRKDIYKFFP